MENFLIFYMFDKSNLRSSALENELRYSLKPYSSEVFKIPNRHKQKITSPGHIKKICQKYKAKKNNVK